ncbi:MAG: hypothetical protein N2376_07340 [Clostridia bacterium]|nr:hypothetical protein [Clostridia bacterium]
MNTKLRDEAEKRGYKLQIISSERIQDLKSEIERFSQSEELNGFQKWILSDLYNYSLSRAEFEAKSVVILAVPHPFYADVVFKKDGQTYAAKSLVRPDFNGAHGFIESFSEDFGYHFAKADDLPLKRLGVQSGLCEYGRNNITYIDDVGSNFSLTAYLSDLPCEFDAWRGAVVAKACANCNVCIHSCPTGAIRKDRFLIDNQRCLSTLNEMPGEFPDWLPETVHHTCYDCMRCQEKCPMNIGHLDKMEGSVVFSEEETEMLLTAVPLEQLLPELRQKLWTLGMDEWYDAMPRNIKALMRR